MLCGVVGGMPQSAAWAGGWVLAWLYAPPALSCAQTGEDETGSHLIARCAMPDQHVMRGLTSSWPLPFKFAKVTDRIYQAQLTPHIMLNALQQCRPQQAFELQFRHCDHRHKT